MFTRIAKTSLLILLFVAPSELAQRNAAASQRAAVPDFTVIAKAGDSFYETMGELAKDLPSINSPGATAHAIDRWTEANEAFTNVFDTFLKENEHSPKQAPSKGNPELLSVSKKINSIQKDYPGLIPGLRSLLDRFRSDPDVAKSAQRLQSSLDRLKKVLNAALAAIGEGK